MNQYWWGNADKAAKSTYLHCSMCPKFNPGKLIRTVPDVLICPVDHSDLANGFRTIAPIYWTEVDSGNGLHVFRLD